MEMLSVTYDERPALQLPQFGVFLGKMVPSSLLKRIPSSLLPGGIPYLATFFFQAEDGIRDYKVTGVQTCALPIWPPRPPRGPSPHPGGPQVPAEDDGPGIGAPRDPDRLAPRVRFEGIHAGDDRPDRRLRGRCGEGEAPRRRPGDALPDLQGAHQEGLQSDPVRLRPRLPRVVREPRRSMPGVLPRTPGRQRVITRVDPRPLRRLGGVRRSPSSPGSGSRPARATGRRPGRGLVNGRTRGRPEAPRRDAMAGGTRGPGPPPGFPTPRPAPRSQATVEPSRRPTSPWARSPPGSRTSGSSPPTPDARAPCCRSHTPPRRTARSSSRNSARPSGSGTAAIRSVACRRGGRSAPPGSPRGRPMPGGPGPRA